MPWGEETATGAGRALRATPWILAGGSLLVFVLRLAVGGGSEVPVLGFVAIGIVTVVLIFGWSKRLDRQAREAGGQHHAVFSCSTTVQHQPFKQVPRFAPALERVRLGWLVGGWLIGKLFVSAEGVEWVPNRWTRRVFRAPELAVPWNDVEHAAAIDQPGPRDPGILEIKLRDGSEFAFLINRRKELALALAELRPT